MGLRNSIKKLIVADHLQNIDSYISAESLYVSLHNGSNKVSYATLYQCLRWLTDHGFVECSTENAAGRHSTSTYRLHHDLMGGLKQ